MERLELDHSARRTRVLLYVVRIRIHNCHPSCPVIFWLSTLRLYPWSLSSLWSGRYPSRHPSPIAVLPFFFQYLPEDMTYVCCREAPIYWLIQLLYALIARVVKKDDRNVSRVSTFHNWRKKHRTVLRMLLKYHCKILSSFKNSMIRKWLR